RDQLLERRVVFHLVARQERQVRRGEQARQVRCDIAAETLEHAELMKNCRRDHEHALRRPVAHGRRSLTRWFSNRSTSSAVFSLRSLYPATPCFHKSARTWHWIAPRLRSGPGSRDVAGGPSLSSRRASASVSS